jgi:hypothetical protein
MKFTAVGARAATLLGLVVIALPLVCLAGACGTKHGTGFDGSWRDKSNGDRVEIAKSGEGFTISTPGSDLFSDVPAMQSGSTLNFQWSGRDFTWTLKGDELIDSIGHVWVRD